MTIVYYDDDANPALLDGKTVGLIGYGALGSSVALNLRDSGIDVIVSGDGEDQTRAGEDGFAIDTIANVTKNNDVIVLATTDERMTSLYMLEVSPNLQKGDTLIFISAYNVAFGFIEPPPFVDVGLVAPRVIGDTVRLRYEMGVGYPSFVAVWQDASRSAWGRVLAVAAGMGALRAGAIEVSIQQEAELNLFIQQAIVPAFHHILLNASELLMKQGYPTEAVLLDLYLGGKFSDYVAQAAHRGLLQALKLTTKTGQYGTFSRMDRFNDLRLERLMEVTLEEIRSGEFARDWAREFADGEPRLRKLAKFHENRDLWELEQQTLDLVGEVEPDETDFY